MANILVVFGATGNQGGSVIHHVVNDPELSKMYTIRAITRDPTSSSAQKLQSTYPSITLSTGDITIPSTLPACLANAHTVFALTAPSFTTSDPFTHELNQGKCIADACITAHVTYLIFSTLPNITSLSQGKYKNVWSFDAKAAAETYIRSLPIKSAFFAPASFMQNMHGATAPRPNPSGDGSYVMARPVSATAKLALIDTRGDAGKFVGAILAAPDEYEGATFCAATKQYTMSEMARVMSEKSGKKVVYMQVPVEVYKGFLPEGYGDSLCEMMLFQEEFGYYGEGTEEKVKWAVERARGTPRGFEEFLEAEPLNLK